MPNQTNTERILALRDQVTDLTARSEATRQELERARNTQDRFEQALAGFRERLAAVEQTAAELKQNAEKADRWRLACWGALFGCLLSLVTNLILLVVRAGGSVPTR